MKKVYNVTKQTDMLKYRERFIKFSVEGEFLTDVLNQWLAENPGSLILDVAYAADDWSSTAVITYNLDNERAAKTNTGLHFIEMTESGGNEAIDTQLNHWREEHPQAQICDIRYGYSAGDWNVLVMYKE